MRVSWKVHRLTKKELCDSNDTWHALNSTLPDTNFIVSFQINPHWISNSGLWKVFSGRRCVMKVVGSFVCVRREWWSVVNWDVIWMFSRQHSESVGIRITHLNNNQKAFGQSEGVFIQPPTTILTFMIHKRSWQHIITINTYHTIALIFNYIINERAWMTRELFGWRCLYSERPPLFN